VIVAVDFRLVKMTIGRAIRWPTEATESDAGIPRIDGKNRRRTDTTDRITLPTNAVGKKQMSCVRHYAVLYV